MFPCYLATLSLQVQANSQFYKIHQTKIVKKIKKKKKSRNTNYQFISFMELEMTILSMLLIYLYIQSF